MLAALGVLVGEASTGVSWWALSACHHACQELHGLPGSMLPVLRGLPLVRMPAAPAALAVLRRVDAGKVELDGAQYLGFSLPFSISQLLWIEVLLVGGAEIYRNSSTDLEERIYPGAFPPTCTHQSRLSRDRFLFGHAC